MPNFPSASSGPTRLPPFRLSAVGWVLAGLVAVSTWTACTGSSPSVESVKAPREVTSDGLELVRTKPRSRLWVRPDHHLGRYDDILISGIGFAYGTDQDRLEEAQEEELGKMLEGAIVGITESGPVGLTKEAGPCVVSIQLGLKDILLHIAETSGSSVSYVSSFGSATMVVEFRDSTTDLPLLRYAANRGLGGGPGTGQVGANMGRLGRALAEMVTDMTTELQTIVPDTTVRPETECNDGIYILTGRG